MKWAFFALLQCLRLSRCETLSQKSQKSQPILREKLSLYIIIILIPYVIIDIYSVKTLSLIFACDICDFVIL
jgi:hypothetical protein